MSIFRKGKRREGERGVLEYVTLEGKLKRSIGGDYRLDLSSYQYSERGKKRWGERGVLEYVALEGKLKRGMECGISRERGMISERIFHISTQKGKKREGGREGVLE